MKKASVFLLSLACIAAVSFASIQTTKNTKKEIKKEQQKKEIKKDCSWTCPFS